MNKLALTLSVLAILAAGFAIVEQDRVSSPVAAAVNGDTTSYQNLVLQTYSGATSTLSVGCIQTLATSSATTIKLVPVATSTNVGTGVSLVLQASYGTCP